MTVFKARCELLLLPSFSFSLSMSIAFSSIPTSETAPASAHSPNSDEEKEEVESDNQWPIQEYVVVKVNRTLHQKMGVSTEFLTI